MKKEGLLNPQILDAIAALGHTQYLVIADAGLPLPDSVPVIDISLTRGSPAFADVLEAVCAELVVESYICAREIGAENKYVHQLITRTLPDQEEILISHAEFKSRLNKAAAIIRTGECTPYANIILVGGVNF